MSFYPGITENHLINNLFYVPMGSFFGSELCDLIGLYALRKLEYLYDLKEIGLYRDDGLAIIQPKNNQIRKQKEKNNKNIQRHRF